MQFFLINNRFIRNAYLNHAVTQAYENLIEKESFPFYVLFLEIDPSRVDVNVHPTKQEVKFEDDRMMYTYLNAAVKHALARYNIAPALDFTLTPEIQKLSAVQMPVTDRQREETQRGYLFNAFTDKHQAHIVEKKDSLKQWKELYEIAQAAPDAAPVSVQTSLLGSNGPTEPKSGSSAMLIHGSWLATTVKSGLMLIHISRAQERIWYERLLKDWNDQSASSQQLLFPISLEFSPQDTLLLTEALPDLSRIGFDIASFGKNAFIVQGMPAGLAPGEEKSILDEVIDHLKHEAQDTVANKRTELLIGHMARRLSRNKEAYSHAESQQALIDELFACGQPEYTPGGKKVFIIVKKDELEAMLG
jgi:DNA mismatch repair protein MutL